MGTAMTGMMARMGMEPVPPPGLMDDQVGHTVEGAVFIEDAEEIGDANHGDEQVGAEAGHQFAVAQAIDPAQDQGQRDGDDAHIGLAGKAQHDGHEDGQQRDDGQRVHQETSFAFCAFLLRTMRS